MKIIILGGGITGLTAAYKLAARKHDVVLYEKQWEFGGLASGFKGKPSWDWSLERAYHHIFKGDSEILSLANETGFNTFFFQEPQTASLYKDGIDNYRTIPVDTPQDFLSIPYLSLPEKIRGAAVLAFLKVSPFLSLYEKHTAKEFLRKYMGERAWVVLWEQLFLKKFGDYAEKILTSFIWARIKKRTKGLGYARGGFQAFVDNLVVEGKERGAQLNEGRGVVGMEKTGRGFIVATVDEKNTLKTEEADIIISTLPTPTLIRVGKKVLPSKTLNGFNKLRYLSAVNLILESDTPLLEKIYWLNVCDGDLPIMGIVQHTNFIDNKYYGGKHLTYVANYVDDNSPLLRMKQEEAVSFFLPHLKRINPQFVPTGGYLFKAPFAQPIFEKEFLKNKPGFETEIPNFYIANLDMTYPYDRGTNYAVKLGLEVASLI